jgi:hypothetical protein
MPEFPAVGIRLDIEIERWIGQTPCHYYNISREIGDVLLGELGVFLTMHDGLPN